MQPFFKYLVSATLLLGLIGCQNDSSDKKMASTPSSQQPAKQAPGPMGQMQQAPAPNVNLADGEADKFVQAAMNMQKIQMQTQQKMMGIIKDQGLDIQTYQKIAQAKRKGKAAGKSDVSDEQMKEFNDASKAMQQAQKGVQKKMIAAIEDAGMKKERFQKISMAARQDSALQQKIQQKMKKQMKGMQPPAPSGK